MPLTSEKDSIKSSVIYLCLGQKRNPKQTNDTENTTLKSYMRSSKALLIGTIIALNYFVLKSKRMKINELCT